MKTNFEIPYDRYALIAEIAQRSHSLGRTALQKHLYLLQALFEVDVRYDFTLYTYGPFTSEILSDLDVAEAMGAVSVSFNPSGYGAYVIKPGADYERIQSKAKPFLNTISDKLEKQFNDFGSFTAKELELRATIVYASRELAKAGQPSGELLDTVHEIKPGFTREQIESAISDLVNKGYILSN